MKKGDGIQKRQEIKQGKSLLLGFESSAKAEQGMKTIGKYYKLPEWVKLECIADVDNPGKIAVCAGEDTYITIDATVNWIVEDEVGITYKSNGGAAIINLKDEPGWVVIDSATPQYQSGVEHMSDEDLRASIDSLRSARVTQPARVRTTRTKTPREPAMSAHDKKLSTVLSKMSPEAMLALQKKLGLI